MPPRHNVDKRRQTWTSVHNRRQNVHKRRQPSLSTFALGAYLEPPWSLQINAFNAWSLQIHQFQCLEPPNLTISMPGASKSIDSDAWSLQIHRFSCLEPPNPSRTMPGASNSTDFQAWGHKPQSPRACQQPMEPRSPGVGGMRRQPANPAEVH